MRAAETIAGLHSFEQRGAGTDAERRAARWLAQRLETPRRTVRTEPFWCRPNWALAHAWHAGLGLAGSLLSVSAPRAGGALLLIALLSLIADELTGRSLGRRLTPEHASQNVIATPGTPARGANETPIRLIITANYDAGRTGLAYRDLLRRPAARLRRTAGRVAPGWLGWLAILLTALLAVAILRVLGHHGGLVGALQLVPTVGLVLALALLLELAGARYGPAAGANGSGVAVALALADALAVAPPPRVSVELVLTGAGETGIGLRQFLRARRKELNAANTVVVGIGPCGGGRPRWWISDGPLVPMLYLDRLRRLCQQLAADDDLRGGQVDDARTPQLAGHRGRGTAPALPARAARLPAISIGCLDEIGLAPRSHQPDDRPDTIEPASIDAGLQFGMLLVDAIAGYLRERDSGLASRPRAGASQG